MTDQLFSVIASTLVIWVFLGVCVVLLVYADKKHEDRKHERWRAEGIYWPESVDSDETRPPVDTLKCG